MSKIIEGYFGGYAGVTHRGRNRGSAFDVFSLRIFDLPMLIRAHTRDCADVDVPAAHVPDLVFYNSAGTRVTVPPIETSLPPTGCNIETMCVERIIAAKAREYVVAGAPKLGASISALPELTTRVITSQGFLYDPIKIATLQWKNAGWGTAKFIPPSDCLTHAAAFGFVKDRAIALELTACAIGVTHPDQCCAASGVAVASIVHSLLRGRAGDIAGAIAEGLRRLPPSRHKTFIAAAEGDFRRIRALGVPMHVYVGLGTFIWVVKQLNSDKFNANAILDQIVELGDPIAVDIYLMLAGIVFGCAGMCNYVDAASNWSAFRYARAHLLEVISLMDC